MSEKEKTWLEKVNEKITDEFYYKLYYLTKYSLWTDAIGMKHDILLFFEYFESQIEKIKELKGKPISLKNYLETLIPSGELYPSGGIVSRKVAEETLSINRQRIFLFNALAIKLKNLMVLDSTLRTAVGIVSDQLDQEIIAALNNLAVSIAEPKFHLLANIVARYSSNKDKANAVYKFLAETLELNGIKHTFDFRDVLLFMREQIEQPYSIATKKNAFEGNFYLERLCVLVYYEFYRLYQLATLENSEILTEVGKLETEKPPQYSLHQKNRIIDAAIRLSEKPNKWTELDLVEELRISKTTFDKQKKFFGWERIQMLRDEVQAIIRRKENM